MECVGVRWVLAVAVALCLHHHMVAAQPQVPCLFIFGDSLVDNGNNNNIQSLAKANYLPYGIDFPNGPTGRFSNGKTTVDVVGMLPPLPPPIYTNYYFVIKYSYVALFSSKLNFHVHGFGLLPTQLNQDNYIANFQTC